MRKTLVHFMIIPLFIFIFSFTTAVPVRADVLIGHDLLTYTGDGGDLLASPPWQDDGTSFEYSVWKRDDGRYLYSYTFDAAPGLDGLFIEVSEGATLANFEFPSSDLDGHDGPAHLSDVLPISLPVPDLFGLVLFPEVDQVSNTFDIISDRAPVWGSFLAGRLGDVECNDDPASEEKCDLEGIPLAANSGIIPDDGGGAFILRPDTTSSVPEPGTLLLLGTGLIGAVIVRRKKVN